MGKKIYFYSQIDQRSKPLTTTISFVHHPSVVYMHLEFETWAATNSIASTQDLRYNKQE